MSKQMRLFIKNVIFAVGANMTRIITTLILTLLLPKIMSVESYSYWQLYHFYATYLVYSTLGWTEGLYMKYGGTDYQGLNKKLISSQVWGIAIHEMAFACVVILVCRLLMQNDTLKFGLMVGAVIYMIIHILLSQLQTVLQASNRISDYARVYSFERILFLVISIVCVLIGRIGFWSFILAEIISNIVLTIYALFLCQKVVFVKPVGFREGFQEERSLIRIGCSISLASFLGQLIIGVVRFGVEQRYGTVAFGKLSLSFSMANMAVTCITAVSIVIFPALKRLDKEKADRLYLPIRSLMTFPLFGILLFYTPVKHILTLWLPEYADSLRYLAVLLPFCIYEVRNSVLTCTYLKVWMAQKYILYANVITLAVSILVTWITVFTIGSIDLAAVSIMALYALKTILTELAVKKYISLKLCSATICELLLTIIFMVLSWFCSPILAFLGYLLCYCLYVYLGRKQFIDAYYTMKGAVG